MRRGESVLRLFSMVLILFACWSSTIGQSKQIAESLRNWKAITASAQSAPHLENYKFLFSFPHDDIVTCAAFSHDGRWLATGSEAGTIIVVDLATQKQRKIEGLYPNGNGINVVSFSDDGKLLLTGGWGHTDFKDTGLIKILQTSDYSVVQTLDTSQGHTVDFLSISNDNKWLISADESKINVWDFQAKRIIRTIPRLDAKLFFDGVRTLVMGIGVTNESDSVMFRRSVPSGSIVFVDIVDGEIKKEIRTVSPKPIRGLAVVSGSDQLVVLAQTDQSYVVHLVDGRHDKILKSISIKPYQPEPGYRLIGSPRIDFGISANYHVAFYNDRRVTYLIDYDAGRVSSFEHRSQVGFSFDNAGKRFAVLGGINNAALTGMPSQNYWTVSVFSFDPTTTTKP